MVGRAGVYLILGQLPYWAEPASLCGPKFTHSGLVPAAMRLVQRRLSWWCSLGQYCRLGSHLHFCIFFVTTCVKL
jgi:hypothetical protein